MTDNDRFNEVMAMVINDVLTEVSIREDHAPISAPAINQLLFQTNRQLAPIIEDLYGRFAKEGQTPADFITEASESLLRLAFDYGFRAGRIWQARDYGVDLPEEG